MISLSIFDVSSACLRCGTGSIFVPSFVDVSLKLTQTSGFCRRALDQVLAAGPWGEQHLVYDTGDITLKAKHWRQYRADFPRRLRTVDKIKTSSRYISTRPKTEKIPPFHMNIVVNRPDNSCDAAIIGAAPLRLGGGSPYARRRCFGPRVRRSDVVLAPQHAVRHEASFTVDCDTYCRAARAL